MQGSSSATPSSSAYLQHCFQHTYLRCTPENQPFLAFHWVDHVDLWFGHVWPLQESNGKPKTEKFEDLSSLLGAPWDWSFAAGTATHMPKCGSQPTWMIFIQVARLDCMEWSCSKPHLQLVLDQCLSKSDGCGFEINIFWQILKPPMTSTNQTADVSDFLACWLRWPDWNFSETATDWPGRCCIGAGTSIAMHCFIWRQFSTPFQSIEANKNLRSEEKKMLCNHS